MIQYITLPDLKILMHECTSSVLSAVAGEAKLVLTSLSTSGSQHVD